MFAVVEGGKRNNESSYHKFLRRFSELMGKERLRIRKQSQHKLTAGAQPPPLGLDPAASGN